MWHHFSEVTSAIARVQLRTTPGYIDICVRSAEQFNEAVAGSDLVRPQAVPEGRVNTYHLWAATYEGDDQDLSYDDFQRIASQQGVNFMWRYIQEPPYLHDVIRQPVAFGRGCPIECPLRGRDAMYEKGTCPTAELIMSRLMLGHTGGDPDVNAKTADALARALEVVRG
jgi:hypothetical protein